MSDDDLDLTSGDPSAAEDRPRRRRRVGSSGEKDKPKSSPRPDGEVSGLANEALTKLAAMREKQGDEELADALKEEADNMAQGFVMLTSGLLKPLRVPLLVVLNLLLVFLAFGRVAQILFARFMLRRQQRQQEWEQQQAEMAAAGNGAEVPVA